MREDREDSHVSLSKCHTKVPLPPRQRLRYAHVLTHLRKGDPRQSKVQEPRGKPGTSLAPHPFICAFLIPLRTMEQRYASWCSILHHAQLFYFVERQNHSTHAGTCVHLEVRTCQYLPSHTKDR